ncbi:MAG TPA: hypothetical protein VHX37_02740 [Acidobacteriaceae bacterium]|jgi:hypothetical protein|nr:hypothetical protein [Acidobacteriaceae bacterium]
MQRQFNVFSPIIVVCEGETFLWTVNQAELGSASQVVVEPLLGGTWALDQPSYSVKPNAPATAKVVGNLGTPFMCTPRAGNVGTQKIITTPKPPSAACAGATVAPGNYFIWLNESAGTQIIRPNPNNPDYWPLPQPHYAVPPHSWIAVAVPADATDGDYPVTVTDKLGGSQCPDDAQPIIIVQSN